jgi:hypothetical protein
MLALLLAASALSAAEDPLAAVEGMYEKARYKEALKALPASCEETDDAARCERLRGFIHIALGAERDARAAFERMIAAQPEATLGDEVSPKMQVVFEDARRVVLAVLAIEIEPPMSAARGTVLLEARVPEGASIEELTLYVGVGDELEPYEMEQRSGVWSTRVRADADELRYYLVAKLPSGALIRAASPKEPRTVRVDEDAPRPTSSRERRVVEDPLQPPAELERTDELGPFGFPKWAFWGAVAGGVLVVGAGIALAVVLSSDPEPGEIRVRVVYEDQ